jgi:hypothetical protein
MKQNDLITYAAIAIIVYLLFFKEKEEKAATPPATTTPAATPPAAPPTSTSSAAEIKEVGNAIAAGGKAVSSILSAISGGKGFAQTPESGALGDFLANQP